MKIITTLLLVTGAVVTLTSQARADEPLLSPRAKANQIATVPGVTEDQLYRGSDHRQRGWFAAPTMVASGGAVDVDYAHSRVTIAASPRALATFPHLETLAAGSEAAPTHQVAPLK